MNWWIQNCLPIMIGLLAIPVHAQPQSERERADRRQLKKLEDLDRKLSRRRAVPHPTSENRLLHEQASKLIERAKQNRTDRYRFERFAEAADDLLESSDDIFNSRKPSDKEDDDDRPEEVARRLERSYFRVQQADYFAKRSAEPDAGVLVKQATALYQQARGAWDAKQYLSARKLAEAASEIVSALENLAQAAVRVPEPPRIE